MFDAIPGLKERDLVALGPCPVCGKKLMETSDPTFYVVEISHCAHDLRAIQQRIGLAMTIGNDFLASVMGPNRDLAKIVDGPKRVAVHEQCAGSVWHLLNLMKDE